MHENVAGHAGGTGDPSPTARSAGGQCVHGAEVIVFALTRSVRYVCVGWGKRDGRPVPYEGVRSCADVSVEYVGEAFRLPRGGTQAAPYGPQGTLHENVAGYAGRDGRPVPYEMFLSAYLVDGTLPSGEGGNDQHRTLHEKSVGTADTERRRW